MGNVPKYDPKEAAARFNRLRIERPIMWQLGFPLLKLMPEIEKKPIKKNKTT